MLCLVDFGGGGDVLAHGLEVEAGCGFVGDPALGLGDLEGLGGGE
jgi:hypothetical protein